MMQFVSNEQKNCRGDRDIRYDEQTPIERFFKSSEALNEQQEDVEEQIETVDPDASPGFKRKR